MVLAMTNDTMRSEPISEPEIRERSPLTCLHECPACKEKMAIHIDFTALQENYGEQEGIIPHLVLHGNPLHAILCYVDRHGVVRGTSYIASIDLLKDSETYQQLVHLWMRSTLFPAEEPSGNEEEYPQQDALVKES